MDKLSPFCAALLVSFASWGCVDTSAVEPEDESSSARGGATSASGDSDADSNASEALLDDCAVPEMEGRVVLGYVPSWIQNFDGLSDSLDFDTMTHVALAFTNPLTKDGPIQFGERSDAEIKNLVDRAHENGVKVLASIGGAAESDLILELIAEETVDGYVDDLDAYLEKHNLDGVDVDIEGHHVEPTTYGPFVQKLAARIRPQGKIVSAALASFFQDDVRDEALFCFDFINEMAYDAAGGWSGPGEHSARAYARTRAAYWSATRSYPNERIVIGVPFYGYCWGAGCYRDGGQVSFRYIQENYPDQIDGDWIRDEENDREINFNGPSTIEYKADFSSNYGGVMIWDMSQDGAEQELYSALRNGL